MQDLSKKCSVDFALGFCELFLHAADIHVTGKLHFSYIHDNREFTAQGKDGCLSILHRTVIVAVVTGNSHCSCVDCIPIKQSSP
jgi:hypothetical protein